MRAIVAPSSRINRARTTVRSVREPKRLTVDCMFRRVVAVAFAVFALGAACSSKPNPVAKSTSTSKAAGPTPTSTAATCESSTRGPTAASGGKEVSPPGDIPDNQAFVVYDPPSGRYTLKVPEGWSRSDTSDSASFTDKFNSILVAVRDAPAAPTVDSAQTDEFAAVVADDPCALLVSAEVVARPAGTAVFIRYQTDSSPDAVTGKVVRDDVERYEFWRNGTEVVLTLSGAVGADNVDPWKIVTNSFAWL